MKRSRGFFYWINFALLIIIAMQVGAWAGSLVIDLLRDTGAPPLFVSLVAMLAIFASVVITAKSLFRFDTWFDAWLESKRGRKYRIQILNIPRAWSIWLVDKSSESHNPTGCLNHHGVFGFGFFKIKHYDGIIHIARCSWFNAYRFWRFSVEFGKR